MPEASEIGLAAAKPAKKRVCIVGGRHGLRLVPLEAPREVPRRSVGVAPRAWRFFSDDFAQEMVFPLTALFFGTKRPTSPLQSSLASF